MNSELEYRERRFEGLARARSGSGDRRAFFARHVDRGTPEKVQERAHVHPVAGGGFESVPERLERAEPLPAKEIEPEAAEDDRILGVEYLGAADRESFRVYCGPDGRLRDHEGRAYETEQARSWSRGPGYAIFVMDEDGNLYVSPSQEPGRFHHSSFLAGGPVAGAGELRIEDGYLMEMNDESGHYKPRRAHLDCTLEELRRQGADLSRFFGPDLGSE